MRREAIGDVSRAAISSGVTWLSGSRRTTGTAGTHEPSGSLTASSTRVWVATSTLGSSVDLAHRWNRSGEAIHLDARCLEPLFGEPGRAATPVTRSRIDQPTGDQGRSGAGVGDTAGEAVVLVAEVGADPRSFRDRAAGREAAWQWWEPESVGNDAGPVDSLRVLRALEHHRAHGDLSVEGGGFGPPRPQELTGGFCVSSDVLCVATAQDRLGEDEGDPAVSWAYEFKGEIPEAGGEIGVGRARFGDGSGPRFESGLENGGLAITRSKSDRAHGCSSASPSMIVADDPSRSRVARAVGGSISQPTASMARPRASRAEITAARSRPSPQAGSITLTVEVGVRRLSSDAATRRSTRWSGVYQAPVRDRSSGARLTTLGVPVPSTGA